METREYRAFAAAELRAAGRKIVGYAAKFGPLSEDLGGFRERIVPGAFARSIRTGADVRALVDHDQGKIIGRTKSGTLKLHEDNVGLHVEIAPPDTTVARDLMESMKRGDINQMSFAFGLRSDRWIGSGKTKIRELLDVDLYDVSVVAVPAYPDTEVSVRGLAPQIELRWYRESAPLEPGLDYGEERLESERERLQLRVRLAQLL